MHGDSRRDFLGGILAAIGGIAAAAVTTIGCAAPTHDPDRLSGDGPTELVPAGPGNYYANVMPDHVAAVRQGDALAWASNASGGKGLE
jgi:hypothetical protein